MNIHLFFFFVYFACFVSAEPVNFSREVRPIIAKHCFACHGPDEKHREAELRLDTEEGAKQVVDGKAAIVSGQPSKSEAFLRMITSDQDDLMPPPEHGKFLQTSEIELIKIWIEQGASWGKHWAYEPPLKFKLDLEPVRVVDHYIEKKAKAAGLSLNTVADKRMLLRRASFDLTGLPPSDKDLQLYLADDSQQAYEVMLDRYLASSHYGEKWAQHWLDLARYADSQGYEKDNHRTMWRYRDWVIDAFNQDMPYDQFSIEQMAGDLLPSSKQQQILATAFHRNTMTNTEGGTDDEEFRILAVKDRIDTTGLIWMGLSVGCAKCHSHKYDPVSIEEYYQLFAIFNQTEDRDLGSDEPKMAAPTEMQSIQLNELKDEQQALEIKKNKEIARVIAAPEFRSSLESSTKAILEDRSWIKPDIVSVGSKGTVASPQVETDAVVFNPSEDATQLTLELQIDSSFETLRLEALPDARLPNQGPGYAKGEFVLTNVTFSISSNQQWQAIVPSLARANFQVKGFSVQDSFETPDSHKGWGNLKTTGLELRAWYQFSAQNIIQPTTLKITMNFDRPGKMALGKFRWSYSSQPIEAPEFLPSPQVLNALHLPKNNLVPELEKTVHQYVAKQDPVILKLTFTIQQLERKIKAIDIPFIPIMKDLPHDKRRETRLHERGNFLVPGKMVKANFPTAFHHFEPESEKNRLDFAKWLVSKASPLAARVQVNRIWAILFGRGIVASLGDFGSQGSFPSHPQLLDWLAVEFMENGWSQKKLLKMIMLSNTYKRGTSASLEQLKLDPNNIYLARGSRVRLGAEAIRDQALMLSGLLSEKMHGPPVMPPQPVGIWLSVYNATSWQTSQGEDRHRRGLYTYIKRTAPYPSLLIFDGTSRENCTVDRITTNTPLQSFVTLNDPVYVEVALEAGRVIAENGKLHNPVEKINSFFEQATTRLPNQDELEQLQLLYQNAKNHFQQHLEQLESYLRGFELERDFSGDRVEWGSWSIVVSAILNLDECFIKG